MRRILIALGLLFGLIGGAAAGTWHGLASDVPGSTQAPIERVGCNAPDYYCPFGRYRTCDYRGCRCARCGSPGIVYGGPQYQYQYYGRPAPRRCPSGWTVQDGVCKPYRGY